MKKTAFIAALALVGGLASQTASADLFNIGVKAGQVSVENDTSNATAGGVVVALDIPGPINFEGEADTTVSDGSFGSFDYSANQMAAFATIATPGPIYVKGRLGVARTTVDISGLGSDNDTQAAYGLSANFGGWELGWTRTKFNGSRVDYMSLGYNF
ncbi:MAG: hypothetical protein PVJ40_06835 [Gammaproteobacteria bacterium]|jgi:hypothetical protein